MKCLTKLKKIYGMQWNLKVLVEHIKEKNAVELHYARGSDPYQTIDSLQSYQKGHLDIWSKLKRQIKNGHVKTEKNRSPIERVKGVEWLLKPGLR